MPVHAKTQAALDAAHAALDKKRTALRKLDESSDQAGTIAALKAVVDLIDDVPLPTSAAKGATKTKKAKTARR
jgi:hypothetical protein